jgi:hypothetical protein
VSRIFSNKLSFFPLITAALIAGSFTLSSKANAQNAPARNTAAPAAPAAPAKSSASPAPAQNAQPKSQAQAAPGGTIKLAVRIIGLTDDQGKTTLNQQSAAQLLQAVNQEYRQNSCGIEFDFQSFQAANPQDMGLEYNTSSLSDLDRYRSQFDDGKSLLIVNTGKWAPSMAPANAWTAMPGESPMGSVFEASVAGYPQIVAHELGHYLGLNHVSDDHNMMNPVIESYSTQITPEQCAEMLKTAQTTIAFASR